MTHPPPFFKRDHWLHIAFLALILGVVPSFSVVAQQVKVMQYNIEGHIGKIESNHVAGAKAIGRIVNYNQPDLLLFCEINCETNAPSLTNTTAIIDWVTNNLPYLGTQTGVTFWVSMSTMSDGYERNGAISRYPIIPGTEFTYNSGPRGLESFQIQLSGTNVLRVYHAHLRCCSDGSGSSNDCTNRQIEAQSDATTIGNNAASSSLPYVFTCDCNEDEDIADRPECTITSSYHPLTTLKQTGKLVEFKPTTLSGVSRTWSTSRSPSIRFDYILAATNRLSPVSGIVFSSSDWANHGLYTNAGTLNSTTDSAFGSDHYAVFATYVFPVPGFIVSPTDPLAGTGFVGGPFSPSNQVYTLSNTNSATLSWNATNSASWLTVSPSSGTLPAGASTNIAASINASANSLAGGNYSDSIIFGDTVSGGSAVVGASLTAVWPPPVASFSGSPLSGVTPVTVTFTNISTGNITGAYWTFGDGSSTNTAVNNVGHTYTAGVYTVTLVVTGPGGVSTNSQPYYITALTPYQVWQIQYFGSTNNPNGAAGADSDGTGQNNLTKFLAGLDPTNPASVFRIVSLNPEGRNLRATWTTVGGHSNVLQSSSGTNSVSYTNVFVDLSPLVIVSGTNESTTNYLIMGAVPAWGTPASASTTNSGNPGTSSVEISAVNTRALANAAGGAPMGGLMMMGSFAIDEASIQSNFNAGNIGAILAAFTPYGASFAVGEGTDCAGTFDAQRSASGFGGLPIYLLAFDQSTQAASTQLGIFTSPTWIFPTNASPATFDLETATDFVVGTNAGPVSFDCFGPVTSADSAQLAIIPGTNRFYRVRLAP